MNDKTIYVNLFNYFTVQFNEHIMQSEQMKSDKLMRLFTYLLFNHQRHIPSSELINVLWRFEDIDNPIGALKNLIYRLRTVLKKEMQISDLIVTGKASYCISDDYKIDIDVHHFEEYNILLNDHPDNEEYYDELLNLYKGKFLRELSDDFYVLSQTTYYHSIFVSRMIEYAYLLEKKEDYKKMEDIAKFALSIDDLDENFYEIYIKALYYQKNYQEAIQTYRSTIDYLYRHLGTKPSEKMYQLFELIKKENHDAGTDIIDIQNELMNDSNRGAYLCEYGTFKELYTIESRMIQRLGICAHICLVTVNDSMLLEKNKAKNKEVVEKTMQKIQTALVNGLRVGDVVSRFSANQFIVLLASCSYENAQMAMDRVLRKINYTLNNKNLSIDLSIDEVLPQVKEA